MYGKYDIPCQLMQAGFSLTFVQAGQQYIYTRTGGDTTVEKMLMISKREILVHPVEPINTPKALTPYILIEFDQTLVIEPRLTRTVFLTFPLEIGIFLRLRSKQFTLLDVFSLAPQKFTLYGEPSIGIICKYWRSRIAETIPAPPALAEGILELTVINTDNDWQEAHKVVLNAYGMKMFYDEHRVVLRAKMKINDGKTAETEFLDAPLDNRMKVAVKTHVARKLSMITTTFTMEQGL